MTEAEALARLTAMLSPDSDPTLTEAELELLLESNKVADQYGLPPTSSAYTDTWNLRKAAAEGWRWKAGKVANRYDFSTDVHSQSRDQLFKHCLEMAKQFGGSLGTIQAVSPASYDPVIGNLNGGA